MYESWFGLFLGEQVLQGRMVSVDDDLAPQDEGPELLERVDHRQKLFLRSHVINLSFDEGLTCIIDDRRLLVQSLPQDRSHRVVGASHMISKGRSQLGLYRIGASISACFNVLNARFPSSSMMKSLSLQRRVVRGLDTFAKSWMNRR